MSVPDAREWSIQYDALKSRIRAHRLDSRGLNAEEKTYISTTIQTLDGQLKTMASSPLQYEISASELARRQVVIENLRKFALGSQSSMTLALLGSSSGSASNPMQEVGTGKDQYNPVRTTDRALVQRQQEVIKLQDDMLLDIEHGVDRLHQQALQIGDETKSQVRLLDDLDNNVDIATAALQAEAKHAERIKDKAQMCWMYICVAVEVIVLFLLIIILFTM